MSSLIAGTITALRKERNWSKLELARRLGGKNPRVMVYRWERGTTIPTPESLDRLAEVFTASGHGTVRALDIDPAGEAFKAAGRPRADRGKPLQQSHPSTDRPGITSELPSPEEGELMPGGLPPIPDAELFREVLGVWNLLRGHEARRDFVEHARDYLGLPRERGARAKNQRR